MAIPDAERCKATLNSGFGFQGRQCKRRAKKDGLCMVHHPEAKKARLNSDRRADRNHLLAENERLKAAYQSSTALAAKNCSEVERLRVGLEEMAVAIARLDSLPVNLRHAHFINLLVRIDGRDENFEFDWVKDLLRQRARAVELLGRPIDWKPSEDKS